MHPAVHTAAALAFPPALSPQVGATFLQMKFVLDHDGEREDVTLEMTLQQFYTFLAQMERAKACVELLSA